MNRLTPHLFALILLTTCKLGLSAPTENPAMRYPVRFPEQQIEISVEVAADEAQREQGLMHRTKLGEKQGMLFIYPDQMTPRNVWMKNTLLPLDILFLAKDGRIVSMLDNLQPCRQKRCRVYDSELPAMYMLEVNAGFIFKYHLKIGQQLKLPAPEGDKAGQ